MHDLVKLAKKQIIVALDVSTRNEAIDLVRMLRDHIGIFKVGLELLNSEGIGIIKEITNYGGKVFLDGKFKDIPNTVAGASRAVTRLGVSMFNVHAMGGIEVMKAALDAASEEASRSGIKHPLILAVTLLTSIDQGTLNKQLKIPGDVNSYVAHLAALADQAGLDGVIASPHEIEVIKQNVSMRMIVVTPGVRPSWAATQDQRRTLTPREAILKGSDYLVIGRPITKPPVKIGNAIDATESIAEEIVDALIKRGI